jgi:hypothetical protein
MFIIVNISAGKPHRPTFPMVSAAIFPRRTRHSLRAASGGSRARPIASAGEGTWTITPVAVQPAG